MYVRPLPCGGKLRIGMRWVKTRRLGEAKRVLKVSELHKKEKIKEYYYSRIYYSRVFL